jgi:hypothetical protein
MAELFGLALWLAAIGLIVLFIAGLLADSEVDGD